MVGMSKTSKMVFAAFTQHYTEYRSDVEGVKDTLDIVASQSFKCTWSIFDIFGIL